MRLTHRILEDAIEKSVFHNYLTAPNKNTSSKASGFVEARAWIKEMSEDVFGCGFCLKHLDLSEHRFKRLLRHLWLEEDKNIGCTLQKELKRFRGAIQREKRRTGYLKRGPKGGAPLIHKLTKQVGVIMLARDVHKSTNDWIGV
jgi:hypothetical protein